MHPRVHTLPRIATLATPQFAGTCEIVKPRPGDHQASSRRQRACSPPTVSAMSHSDWSHGVGVTSAVAAVVEDAAGRVLLCQQHGGHRLWGLPGGKIRAAESPVHAVIRDIREETGLETEIIELVGMYQLTGDGCGTALPDLFVHVFRGRLDGGPALNA